MGGVAYKQCHRQESLPVAQGGMRHSKSTMFGSLVAVPYLVPS